MPEDKGYQNSKGMVDLGVKPEKSEIEPQEVDAPERSRYPGTYIDNPPDFLMDKDIGEKCKVEMVIEITGKSINEFDKKKRKEVNIKLLGMKYLRPAGKLSKDEFLALDEDEREKIERDEIGDDEE